MNGQSQFRAAVLDPSLPEPEGLRGPDDAPAGARFAIYRNNVIVALSEALSASFPTIAKLLGPTNFKAIAGIFVRQHPPRSPVMLFYGAEFPEFLAGLGQLAHLPYLADVARLDEALRLSYHAADAPPAPSAALAEIAAQDLPATRLLLAPAVRVLSSDWPIHGIWRFNHHADAPQPPGGGQCVLITRPEFDPEIHVISPAEARFVAALLEGAPLGPAMETANAIDPDFDLSRILSILLTEAAITEIGA